MVYYILQNRLYLLKCLKNKKFSCIRRHSHELGINKIEPSPEHVYKSPSTLYVPGRRGKDVYQIVKPFIDVEYISKNKEALKKSCQVRGLQLNLDQLVPRLQIWETLKDEYKTLVEKDQVFIEKKKNIDPHCKEFEEITKEHEEFILILKSTKNKLHDIEEQVLPEVECIPNFVDSTTPEKDIVLRQDSPDQRLSSVSHKDVGEKMGLLSFSETSPTSYYLLGELSELEHSINTYFATRLMALDYSPLACPDFCKSFVCEATGLDPNEDCIPLQPPKENNRETAQKHVVVGSSSFETFCAYFVNMNVNESNLPLRYFSQGRNYNALHRNVQVPDLFTVIQAPSIHSLIMCKQSDSSEEFDKLFDHISSCYGNFNIATRIIDASAKSLNSSESRRKRLELWSPSRKSFIPVAHVSQRGDFVSKRLHMTYGVDYHVQGFCSVVEGRAVCIPVLIGCILENYQTPDATFDFQKTFEFLHDCL